MSPGVIRPQLVRQILPDKSWVRRIEHDRPDVLHQKFATRSCEFGGNRRQYEKVPVCTTPMYLSESTLTAPSKYRRQGERIRARMDQRITETEHFDNPYSAIAQSRAIGLPVRRNGPQLIALES